MVILDIAGIDKGLLDGLIRAMTDEDVEQFRRSAYVKARCETCGRVIEVDTFAPLYVCEWCR